MKTRLLVILSLVTLAVFGLGNIARGQNEVTESVTTSYYSTSKVLPLGPDRGYMIFEAFGVLVSDTGEGLFHNATIRCIGASFAEKGSWEGENYCTYTLKDGEKVFIIAKQGGKTGTPMPPGQGTAKMIGGTGKYSGIQGRTEFTTYFLRPSAEGISQMYNKAKIIYKLP
jgi:hypothetical protein